MHSQSTEFVTLQKLEFPFNYLPRGSAPQSNLTHHIFNIKELVITLTAHKSQQPHINTVHHTAVLQLFELCASHLNDLINYLLVKPPGHHTLYAPPTHPPMRDSLL